MEMRENKKWWWLLVCLLLVFLFYGSCHKNPDQQVEVNSTAINNTTQTKSIVKLLSFHFTEITKIYAGDKNSLGQLIPEIRPTVKEFAVRNDGVVRMAEKSSSKYECSLGSSAQSNPACGMKSYYRFKDKQLSAKELTELITLIKPAQKFSWNDSKCNPNGFISQNDLQIEFYDQNKPTHQIKICLSEDTNQFGKYVLPDLPTGLDNLAVELTNIKQDFGDIAWLKGELKNPFSIDWWYQTNLGY